MTRKQKRALPHDGRGWCYLGMLLGGTISVYANVAQKYVATRHPALDGVLLAAAAPVAVWVMLEILIRVRGHSLRSWAARISTLVVAVVAFLTSYQHLHALLLARGESALTARIYPLGIDGLLIGAAAVLWQIRSEAGQGKAPAPGQEARAAQGRPEARSIDLEPDLRPMPGTDEIALRSGQEAGPGQVRAVAPVTPQVRSGQGKAPDPVNATGQVAAARQGKPRATLQVTPEGSEAGRQVNVEDLEAAARAGQVKPTSRAEVKAHFKIGSDRASELIKQYRERNDLQNQEQLSQ